MVDCFVKAGEELVAATYYIVRNVSSSAIISFEVKKYTAYVFGKRKTIYLKAFTNNFYGGTRFSADWMQLTRCPNLYGESINIYPYKKSILKGTYMENSRLLEYLKYKKSLFIEAYLRFYQKHTQIENLFTVGLGGLVAKEFEDCYLTAYRPRTPFEGLDWKVKSPYKLLGVDRNEIKLFRKYNWTYKWLKLFKEVKKSGVKLSEENVSLIMAFRERDTREIITSGESLIKALKYLYKQSSDKKRPTEYYILRDYWSMAQTLGYNLQNPVIKYPKNLGDSHDRANAAIKYEKDRKLMEKFEDMYAKLECLSFDNGKLCIRAARDEKELIKEGRALKHCVGGYGQSHCGGRCIFFLRQSKKPDTPYFTLQVDIATGNIVQNHGYENERDGKAIPTEVTAFAQDWIEKAVRPWIVRMGKTGVGKETKPKTKLKKETAA